MDSFPPSPRYPVSSGTCPGLIPGYILTVPQLLTRPKIFHGYLTTTITAAAPTIRIGMV